jgi:hypothetical protein
VYEARVQLDVHSSRVTHSGDGLPSLSRILIACLNIKNLFSYAEISIYGQMYIQTVGRSKLQASVTTKHYLILG